MFQEKIIKTTNFFFILLVPFNVSPGFISIITPYIHTKNHIATPQKTAWSSAHRSSFPQPIYNMYFPSWVPKYLAMKQTWSLLTSMRFNSFCYLFFKDLFSKNKKFADVTAPVKKIRQCDNLSFFRRCVYSPLWQGVFSTMWPTTDTAASLNYKSAKLSVM